MIESILDTKMKAKIARLFAEQKKPFHVSGAARALNISKSRASECLRALEQSGVLESRAVGRSRVYSAANTRLAAMVLGALSQESRLISEIEGAAVGELKKLKPASIALFGSATKGINAGSDIDILFLSGEKAGNRIYAISAELTQRFGISISITAMGVGEFRRKAKSGEEFVLNVLANHRLLYGKNLEELVW